MVTTDVDVPIVGLADRLAELGAVDDAHAAAALREHAISEDLPLPGGRGVPEAFAWIVDRLRRRRLKEDLGLLPVEVEWFAFHVPPGGSASLKVQRLAEAENGVTLKLVGSGFGSGHTVQLKVADNYLERRKCMRIIQRAQARVRTYELIGKDADNGLDVRADVVQVTSNAIIPWDPCPSCGADAEKLDPFLYEQVAPTVDLSADDSGQRRTESLELTARDEIDVGLSLPMLPGSAQAGVTARRVLKLQCDVEYAFPPRACYTPVKAFGTTTLPFWAVGRWAS